MHPSQTGSPLIGLFSLGFSEYSQSLSLLIPSVSTVDRYFTAAKVSMISSLPYNELNERNGVGNSSIIQKKKKAKQKVVSFN